MKRACAWGLLTVTVSFMLFQAMTYGRMHDEAKLRDRTDFECLGYDFLFRMGEVELLKERIDPYDVWSGAVSHRKFYPLDKPDLKTSVRYRPITAYTPWGYGFFLPMAWLSLDAAWGSYYVLMLMAVCLWVVAAFRYGREMLGDYDGGAWVAAIALFSGPAVAMGMICANHAVLIGGALAILIWGLRRYDAVGDVLAAIALAFMMMKPQTALPFVIPILLKRRFRVLVVATAICLVASAVPALLVGKSPVTLALEAPKASAFAFSGCGLMPWLLFCKLVSLGAAREQLLLVAALLGGGFCLWETFILRKTENWFVLFAPAALCSVSWTYVFVHGHCVSWVPLSVIAVDLWCARSKSRRIFDLALLAVVARLYYVPVKAMMAWGMGSPNVLAVVNTSLSEASSLIAFAGIGVWALYARDGWVFRRICPNEFRDRMVTKKESRI